VQAEACEKENTMYGPNTPSEEPEERQPEWREPFPEPNTIPSGWSFSTPVSSTVMEVEEPGEES
jgi:hypothetical protein